MKRLKCIRCGKNEEVKGCLNCNDCHKKILEGEVLPYSEIYINKKEKHLTKKD